MCTGRHVGRHGGGDVRRQRGFGLLLMLFAVAGIGLVLAGAGEVWHTAAQREKEAELLFAGHQFRRAILSYHEASPEAAKQYPERLEDLLEDRRFPGMRRHLRRIYADPFTGRPDWALVRLQGRIVGVHSLSTAPALRQRFDARDAALEGASRHDEWVFGSAEAPALAAAALAAEGAAGERPR